jgi:hypothetical protein
MKAKSCISNRRSFLEIVGLRPFPRMEIPSPFSSAPDDFSRLKKL